MPVISKQTGFENSVPFRRFGCEENSVRFMPPVPYNQRSDEVRYHSVNLPNCICSHTCKRYTTHVHCYLVIVFISQLN